MEGFGGLFKRVPGCGLRIGFSVALSGPDMPGQMQVLWNLGVFAGGMWVGWSEAMAFECLCFKVLDVYG